MEFQEQLQLLNMYKQWLKKDNTRLEGAVSFAVFLNEHKLYDEKKVKDYIKKGII